MKQLFFTFTYIVLHLHGFAQIDCDKLYKKEIFPINDSSNIYIEQLLDCGFDTFSLQVSTITYIDYIQNVDIFEHRKNVITIQKYVEIYNERKDDSLIISVIKKLQNIENVFKLEANKGSYINKDRKEISKLYQSDTLMFEYIEQKLLSKMENSSDRKSYEELFKEINLEYLEDYHFQKLIDTILYKKAIWNHYNDLLPSMNVQYFINKNIDTSKTLLLFFNKKDDCRHCRTYEKKYLSNHFVYNLLKENFIVVNLYIDDDTLLPENFNIETDKTFKFKGNKKHEFTSVGEFNRASLFEYKTLHTPAFIAINANGEVIDKCLLLLDYHNMIEFLNDVIEKTNLTTIKK